MHKIILIIVILFSSIFAETLYLKNMTKIKATVVEVAEENVKYTLGRYGGYTYPARKIYTIKKTDIIAILYEDGSIYAIENIEEKLILEKIEEIDKRIEIKETEENLQREKIAAKILASSLNSIPGLGSFVIMDDMTGAVTQWALLGSGISLFAYNFQGINPPFILGILLIHGSIMYGIIRPYTYNAASTRNSGFNMAILPNKDGDLKTYLSYNMAF